jgi:CBS domain containing-hemolysin-like protein
MTRTKIIPTTLLITVSALLAPLSIFAQTSDTVTVVTTDPNFTFVRNLTPAFYIGSAITLLLGLSGVGAFIFLLWGGLQWITAGGDKDAIEKSRKKIIQALVGLAIVFSSYAILFILRVLFNVNVIGFTLGPLTAN